jgi:uncharacterized membrane protein YbhN (UPF0104 family)
MNTSNKKYIKKTGQIIIYLVTLFFIGKIIITNWAEIGQVFDQINIAWLILALLIHTSSLLFQSYIWHSLLKFYKPFLPFKLSYSTYFRSIITRYLPGGIWVYFARIHLTEKLGFKKTQGLFLIIAESILAVLSGSLIYLLIRSNSIYNPIIIILSILLFVLCILFLYSPKKLIKIYKLLTNKILEIVPLKTRNIIYIAFLYILQWALVGLGIWCLIYSVTPTEYVNLLQIVGIFAISWVIGFIILITPSGIGVRESVLIILLSSIISIELAAIISILSRILFTLGELLHFGISLPIKIPDNKKDNPSNKSAS